MAVELRERLADLCHRRWSGWIERQFGKCLLLDQYSRIENAPELTPLSEDF